MLSEAIKDEHSLEAAKRRFAEFLLPYAAEHGCRSGEILDIGEVAFSDKRVALVHNVFGSRFYDFQTTATDCGLFVRRIIYPHEVRSTDGKSPVKTELEFIDEVIVGKTGYESDWLLQETNGVPFENPEGRTKFILQMEAQKKSFALSDERKTVHELGKLFGYPERDVEDFIENDGQDWIDVYPALTHRTYRPSEEAARLNEKYIAAFRKYSPKLALALGLTDESCGNSQ